MDLTKVDLNKPYSELNGTVGKSVEEPKDIKEEPVIVVEEKKEPDTSDEENKVPYSRFKKYHDAAKEAEEEAAGWRRKYEEALESRPVYNQESPSDPSREWIELYGDSDASKRAWGIEQRRQDSLKEEFRQDALQAVREERQQESQKLQENLGTVDEHMELVSAAAGRDLTETEQSSVLDIIDEYTPKDDEGNYLGGLLPADKAWEIYELKHRIANEPKQKSRDNVANLTSSQTNGEPTAEQLERNKNWNPLDWNAWQKRL